MDDGDFAGASGTKEDNTGPIEISLGPIKASRYLLVSSGCAICLLDLKHETLSKVDGRVHALPKMATLNLIDENLPVSAGLVRFGSAVFMIGGHTFVPDKQERRSKLLEITQNCEFYNDLFVRHPLRLMGTSTSYRLTLERGDDGFILCPDPECDDMLALEPKFWPTAVEVDGQVHIFESDPSGLVSPDVGWRFSHEVIRGDGWVQIPTRNLRMCSVIHRYLVLGPYIYAVSGTERCLLFDSREMKWNLIERKRSRSNRDWLYAKCVFDILLLRRFSWKIGEIGVGDDLHYVILCLDDANFAIFYLVTSTTGQIVSIQTMPYLFSGASLTMPMMPHRMLSGTIIKASEDSDSEGETLCLIMNAYADMDEYGYEVGDVFLFIYTLKVKALGKNVSEIPVNPSCLLQEFVSIDIKEGFVFEANADFDSKPCDINSSLVGIQASFVDESFVDRAFHG